MALSALFISGNSGRVSELTGFRTVFDHRLFRIKLLGCMYPANAEYVLVGSKRLNELCRKPQGLFETRSHIKLAVASERMIENISYHSVEELHYVATDTY